ncbi:MAG: flavodoxin domain-containing protein [Chloroflexota bacterium]|nr:flavodoxin domain-containing protein [Chloroflexota bacterium]
MAKKVLVLYYSQTGNTEEMAKAVADGASSVADTEVTLKVPSEAVGDDIISYDAIAFGSPTYSAYMAGALKDFFDRNLMSLVGKVAGKPYVAFGSTGFGGDDAMTGINRICGTMGLNKVADPVIATLKPSDDVISQCKELGKKIASS